MFAPPSVTLSQPFDLSLKYLFTNAVMRTSIYWYLQPMHDVVYFQLGDESSTGVYGVEKKITRPPESLFGNLG